MKVFSIQTLILLIIVASIFEVSSKQKGKSGSKLRSQPKAKDSADDSSCLDCDKKPEKIETMDSADEFGSESIMLTASKRELKKQMYQSRKEYITSLISVAMELKPFLQSLGFLPNQPIEPWEILVALRTFVPDHIHHPVVAFNYVFPDFEFISEADMMTLYTDAITLKSEEEKFERFYEEREKRLEAQNKTTQPPFIV